MSMSRMLYEVHSKTKCKKNCSPPDLVAFHCEKSNINGSYNFLFEKKFDKYPLRKADVISPVIKKNKNIFYSRLTKLLKSTGNKMIFMLKKHKINTFIT